MAKLRDTLVVSIGVAGMVWLLAAWWVATPALAQAAGALAVNVRGVESGEVLNAIYDGRLERVRLIGVDVPGCMDLEARQRLDGLARGRVAFLELDDVERDGQGAVLGYLWIDGVMVNLRLVSEGYATPILDPFNQRYDYDLKSAGDTARRLRLGFWTRNDCG